MTQQNNEFEKWFDKQLDNENAFTSDEPICKQSWIAAKADNVREIAELRAKVSELDGMLGSLQSYINVLREALEEASIFVDNHSEDWYKSGQVLLIKCKQALASTPAQSLQAHDDEGAVALYEAPPQPQTVKDALEKAAKIVQAKIGHYYLTPLTDAVTEIRALIED